MTWIIIGFGVPGAIAVMWLSRRYRHDQDLGSVSGQWLAEHRQNHEC